MNSTFQFAKTIALFSVIAGVAAGEGFKPYLDPTLPNRTRRIGASFGGDGIMEVSVTADCPKHAGRVLSEGASGRRLQMRRVVVMRPTQFRHRIARSADPRARALS